MSTKLSFKGSPRLLFLRVIARDSINLDISSGGVLAKSSEAERAEFFRFSSRTTSLLRYSGLWSSP
eukprot:6159044-Heterocapsa_arctica.AAC.1